jgi:hypothetical protein
MITQAIMISHTMSLLDVLAGCRKIAQRDCSTPNVCFTSLLVDSCGPRVVVTGTLASLPRHQHHTTTVARGLDAYSYEIRPELVEESTVACNGGGGGAVGGEVSGGQVYRVCVWLEGPERINNRATWTRNLLARPQSRPKFWLGIH